MIPTTTPARRASRLPVTLLALGAAALLAACGSTTSLNEKPAVPVETRTPTPAAGTGAPAAPTAAAQPAPQSQVTTVDLARQAAEAAARAPRIVYFDFDSFAIRDEFKPMLDTHAKALATQRTRRMSVEGHTDERGGSEYNLALGQKRAEAVVRSLVLLGADEQQLEAVSFGEERPAEAGSSEAAWAKNRRAELRDR